jgi:MFS family permease
VLAGVGAIPASVAGLAVVGAAFFVSGMFIAPGFALTYALLGDLAPTGTVAEAFAWLGTGIGVGVAAGAGLGGVVEGPAGAAGAWAVAAGAAVAGAVLVRVAAVWLRPAPAVREGEPAVELV